MAARHPEPELSEQKEAFLSALRRRRERHERDVRERDQSFWSTVGMMGTVGWSVMLPTAFGVFFGRWLDGGLGSGSGFMVFFMLAGLALGCYIAWRQVAEKI